MKTIGILGGGQLGRMLALAGYPLGLRFIFLEREADCPAGQVAPVVVGDYADPAALARLAERCDLATFEFENVPVEAVQRLRERVPVHPSPFALLSAQDRLHEKTLFTDLGIPTPDFVAVASFIELQSACKRLGFPAVLKTRRLGYDGKGQVVIHSAAEMEPAWRAVNGVPSLVEQFVAFRRECAILGVRAADGREAFYPLTETHHTRGILSTALAPAPHASAALDTLARDYVKRILDRLSYVGVIALELFDCGDGRLIANEIAPRVHNSGHWTQDAGVCSQFENHLRAIAGLPLGDTTPHGYCGMVNLIGDAPALERLVSIPQARVHLYGKEPRPGRKLGHVNFCLPTAADREAAMRATLAILPPR